MDVIAGRGRSRIRRRQDRIKAGRSLRDVDAIPAGRTDRDLGTKIGETDLRSDVAKRGHGDGTAAVCRRACRVACGVSSRRNDDRAHGIHLGDRLLVRGSAGSFASEAEVDHLGRIRVRRNPRHRKPGGPAQAGNDVGVEATTLAQDPHGQDAHTTRDTRHADAVVGERTDQPRYLRAVPRTVVGFGRALVERTAHHRDFGIRHPVARVRGVGIAAIAVVGDVDVADHVVTGKQIAAGADRQQVRMIEANAGIEHRDDDARIAGRDVPRGLDIQRRLHDTVRCAQVPLAHGGTISCHAVAVQRIVRRHQALPALVRDCVLDVRIAREPLRELGRADAFADHDLRVIGKRGPVGHRDTEPFAENVRAAERRNGRRRLLGQ